MYALRPYTRRIYRKMGFVRNYRNTEEVVKCLNPTTKIN